jgi:hypothetical protein
MAGTIETTNNTIITKISALQDLLREINLGNLENLICDAIKKQVNHISEEYEMGSINILTEYFSISFNIIDKEDLVNKKKQYYNEYQGFITKENFISKLDKLYKSIKDVVYNTDSPNSINNKKLNHTLYSLLKLYSNSTVSKYTKDLSYDTCAQCQTKMDVYAATSELVCKSCGMCKELVGTIFEDDQFQFQEGQRFKHATYDPSKHCRFWVDRIQARESTDIPHSVITKLQKCIVHDKITNRNQITCSQIRRYLSQIHNSKYNEHIPLIRKLITGISPPQMSDYEIQLIHIYFDKVIHIFDEIKPPTKTNCPYHPYFIYKIIEQILKTSKDKQRVRNILLCIHLQSRETLIENDRIWKPICSRIPEFEYIPTDRNARSENL